MFRRFWVWWFVAPRCESLGDHSTIMSPWFVIISGPNIRIGHSFTAIGEMHHPVQIGVWGRGFGEGRVELGDACLMSPGAGISASDEVVLGNGCIQYKVRTSIGEFYVISYDTNNVFKKSEKIFLQFSSENIKILSD